MYLCETAAVMLKPCLKRWGVLQSFATLIHVSALGKNAGNIFCVWMFDCFFCTWHIRNLPKTTGDLSLRRSSRSGSRWRCSHRSCGGCACDANSRVSGVRWLKTWCGSFSFALSELFWFLFKDVETRSIQYYYYPIFSNILLVCSNLLFASRLCIH